MTLETQTLTKRYLITTTPTHKTSHTYNRGWCLYDQMVTGPNFGFGGLIAILGEFMPIRVYCFFNLLFGRYVTQTRPTINNTRALHCYSAINDCRPPAEQEARSGGLGGLSTP